MHFRLGGAVLSFRWPRTEGGGDRRWRATRGQSDERKRSERKAWGDAEWATHAIWPLRWDKWHVVMAKLMACCFDGTAVVTKTEAWPLLARAESRHGGFELAFACDGFVAQCSTKKVADYISLLA
jgi:hypothetical protein